MADDDEKEKEAIPQPKPEGLYAEHNMISETAWKVLEHWLEQDEFSTYNVITATATAIASPIPWEIGAQNRRVAQFGFRYNYGTSVVEYECDDVDDDAVPEIPLELRLILLESCSERLRKLLHDTVPPEWDPTAFTQCIINVYDADNIIPWHWDHKEFGPVVLVFTFGEDRPLLLRRLKSSVLLDRTIDNNHNYPLSQCHHEEGSYSEEDYEYYTAYPKHGSCYVLTGPVRYQWEHSVPKGSGFRVSITFRTHCNDHQNDDDA